MNETKFQTAVIVLIIYNHSILPISRYIVMDNLTQIESSISVRLLKEKCQYFFKTLMFNVKVL